MRLISTKPESPAMPWVIYDLANYNHETYAYWANALRLSSARYTVEDYYHKGVVKVEGNAAPIYLSAPMRRMVEYSLMLQGLEPREFIIPATVHGEWKKAWHQGYIITAESIVKPTNTRICTRCWGEVYPLVERLLTQTQS